MNNHSHAKSILASAGFHLECEAMVFSAPYLNSSYFIHSFIQQICIGGSGKKKDNLIEKWLKGNEKTVHRK